MSALAIPLCVGGLGAQGPAEVANKGVFHDFSSPLTYGELELVGTVDTRKSAKRWGSPQVRRIARWSLGYRFNKSE